MPNPALGIHLRGPEFIVMVKFRLGCKIYSVAGPCPACGKPSDVLGDHALCCGQKGERIARHNALRDVIYAVAASAALGPTKEGRFLLPGSDRRPADVLVPHWAGGRDAALDVTVIHSLQGGTVALAAATPGAALKVAHKRKVDGAAEACRRQGIVFVPLACESLGGWHEVADREVRKLGAALARNTGQEEQEATRHLFQRLSVSVMKGNAALLNNRVPNDPDTEVSGIE